MAETSYSQLVVIDSATHMQCMLVKVISVSMPHTRPSVFVSLLCYRTWSVLKCSGVLGRSVLGHAGCSHLPALPHRCCRQDRGEVVLLCQQTVRGKGLVGLRRRKGRRGGRGKRRGVKEEENEETGRDCREQCDRERDHMEGEE